MIRRRLYRRGWISCETCRKMRPRWWAYRFGWWCGGVAGHYDWCRRHRNAGREFVA